MGQDGKIGAVVVGTGFGLFTHVRALRDAGFDVRAIVGRDLEKTKKRAAPLNIPTASNNLEELLANDPDIQLVTVATPPHAHYQPVMQAIAARRAVMCEKPFAKDLAQAREMLNAAQAAGVVHALGAEFRYDSAQALLTRLVQSGAIGEPLMFHRIYQQPGPDVHEELSDWWMDEAQGGGFLGAFGTHMIDQARATVGEIDSLSCILRKLSPSRPTQSSDDYYTLQFRTKNGCMGLLEAALNFPGPFMMGTKVAGTTGAAWIQSGASFGEPEQVWIKDADGARQIPMPDELVNAAPEPFAISELVESEMDRWHSQGFDVAPYAKLFGQLRAQILNIDAPLSDRAADFTDAAANQAILDAARRSAKSNEWTKVEAI